MDHDEPNRPRPPAEAGARNRHPLDPLIMICLAGFSLGWLSFDLPMIFGWVNPGMAFYFTHIDPFTADMPASIELTNTTAAFLFGPFYFATLWGLWRRARWVWKLALPMSGVLVTTSAVHMTAAFVSPTPPVNVPLFLLINGTYPMVGLLMIYRFTRSR